MAFLEPGVANAFEGTGGTGGGGVHWRGVGGGERERFRREEDSGGEWRREIRLDD